MNYMNVSVKLFERLRSMFLLQLLIGFGILFNFTKEMLFAYVYGTGQEIEVFRIAFGIPYALFQSFGTILVGVLMPIYLRKKDSDSGTFNKIAAQTQFFLLMVFVVGIITAVYQAKLLAPGYSGELLSKLEIEIVVCWFFYLIASQTFPIRLYLQSLNRTHLVASTSLILALVTILAVVMGVYLFPVPTEWLLVVANLLAGLVVLGVFIYQGKVVGLPAVKFFPRNLKTYTEDPIYLILMAGFVMIFLNFSQRVMDRSFASLLQSGTVGSLEYAYNIYTAFGLLIGTTAVLLLNRGIAEKFHSNLTGVELKWLLRKVLPLVLISVLLAFVAVYYSNEIIALVYQHGKFQKSDTIITSEIFYYLMMSFPFMVLSMVLMQVMFAVSATNVLLVFAVIKLFAKFVVIEWFFDTGLSMFGVSNLACEFASCLLMVLFLFFRLYSRSAYKLGN